MKRKLVKQKNEILKDREKWQGKLDALNDELDKASDRVYSEKKRGRKLIHEQINKADASVTEMQNYIDELEDCNESQSSELREALKVKRAAIRSTRKAKVVAEKRLKRWHDERTKSRELADDLDDQVTIAKEILAIVEKYGSMILRN